MRFNHYQKNLGVFNINSLYKGHNDQGIIGGLNNKLLKVGYNLSQQSHNKTDNFKIHKVKRELKNLRPQL